MVYCGGSLFAEAPSAGLYKRQLLPPLYDKMYWKQMRFSATFISRAKKQEAKPYLSCRASSSLAVQQQKHSSLINSSFCSSARLYHS